MIFRETAVTLHDMLGQTMILFVIVDEILEHTIEDIGNRKEPLYRRTDITKPLLITEYLLYNKRGHRFGQRLPILHNPKTQRHNFRLHQEPNSTRITLLNQCSNNPQRSHSQILKYFCLCRCVQKRI